MEKKSLKEELKDLEDAVSDFKRVLKEQMVADYNKIKSKINFLIIYVCLVLSLGLYLGSERLEGHLELAELDQELRELTAELDSLYLAERTNSEKRALRLAATAHACLRRLPTAQIKEVGEEVDEEVDIELKELSLLEDK